MKIYINLTMMRLYSDYNGNYIFRDVFSNAVSLQDCLKAINPTFIGFKSPTSKIAVIRRYVKETGDFVLY